MDWITACEIIEVSPDASDTEIKARRTYWAFLLAPDATVGKPEHVRKEAEKEFIKKKAAWEYLLKPENRPAGRPSSSVQKNMAITSIIVLAKAAGHISLNYRDNIMPWIFHHVS